MADNELLVTISGAALSLLFYENVRDRGDQMGFFLGNVYTYVTKNVTDAERHIESTKIHTDIQGILPCLSKDLFYTSSGKLNTEKLKDFVKNKINQIVGWYRFRFDGCMHFTVRDKILHKEFENFFYGSSNDIPEHNFVGCILSYTISNNRGTHKLRHVFLRYKDGDYPPIPLRINNLGADASRHDGSDYKPTPIKSLRHDTDHFAKFCDTLKLDITKTSVLDSMTTILKAAERHLDNLVTDVAKADHEVAELEQEAHELMEKLEENRMKKLRMFNEQMFLQKSYSTGESVYQHNLLKRELELNNLVCLNEETTGKVSSRLIPSDSRKRNSSSSTNISNVCHDTTGNMKKSPSAKNSYSQMTKKQPDATDC